MDGNMSMCSCQHTIPVLLRNGDGRRKCDRDFNMLTPKIGKHAGLFGQKGISVRFGSSNRGCSERSLKTTRAYICMLPTKPTHDSPLPLTPIFSHLSSPLTFLPFRLSPPLRHASWLTTPQHLRVGRLRLSMSCPHYPSYFCELFVHLLHIYLTDAMQEYRCTLSSSKTTVFSGMSGHH